MEVVYTSKGTRGRNCYSSRHCSILAGIWFNRIKLRSVLRLICSHPRIYSLHISNSWRFGQQLKFSKAWRCEPKYSVSSDAAPRVIPSLKLPPHWSRACHPRPTPTLIALRTRASFFSYHPKKRAGHRWLRAHDAGHNGKKASWLAETRAARKIHGNKAARKIRSN